VLEVIRANDSIARCDVITIAYEVHHAEYERQDRSTDPGPAWPTPPPRLHEGERVIAYLKPAVAADGAITYQPNIGMDSFAVITSADAGECAEGSSGG
jgi:hypothetical protein